VLILGPHATGNSVRRNHFRNNAFGVFLNGSKRNTVGYCGRNVVDNVRTRLPDWGPYVAAVYLIGKSTVRVVYGQYVDPTRANNPANYVLTGAGAGFGRRHPIPFTLGKYQEVSRSIDLTANDLNLDLKKLSLEIQIQPAITSGMALGFAGTRYRLDGNYSGKPGTTFQGSHRPGENPVWQGFAFNLGPRGL
jgi:parallel beta-helix repeat protein